MFLVLLEIVHECVDIPIGYVVAIIVIIVELLLALTVMTAKHKTHVGAFCHDILVQA